MIAIAVMIAVVATKISKLRTIVEKLARHVGILEKYRLYTICDKKPQNTADNLLQGDGTESTADEFRYVAMKT